MIPEPQNRARVVSFGCAEEAFYAITWAAELRDFPDVHRIQLERLQTEPEYFAAVFHALTQGRLVADRAYLDRVFAADNLVSGRHSTSAKVRPPGAREQYALWSAWERAEFARDAQRLNLPRLYFPFGHDFSFLAPNAHSDRWWFSTMFS